MMRNQRKNTISALLSRFVIAALCFVAFGLTSCKDKDTEMLEKIVAEVNEKCPLEINQEIKITKIELDKEFLTYYFEYSEESFQIGDIDESAQKALGKEVLKAICNFDGQEKEMVDLLLKKNLGMKFVMDFKRSKKQVTIKFSADKIRESRNGASSSVASTDESTSAESDAASAQESLEADVELSKNSVPMDLGNGITMTDIYLSNGSLYYIYDVDEASVPLESWNDEIIANVKQALISELKSESKTNPAVKRLISLCEQTGTTFVYRYKGDQSGIEYDITLTTDDLR